MINIAEKILPSFGILERSTTEISSDEWKSLGIEPSKADELIEQILEQAEEAKQTGGNFP
jgi:hypothetical protein